MSSSYEHLTEQQKQEIVNKAKEVLYDEVRASLSRLVWLVGTYIDSIHIRDCLSFLQIDVGNNGQPIRPHILSFDPKTGDPWE
jgi:hypothetical protein